jgi:hypothetical protein
MKRCTQQEISTNHKCSGLPPASWAGTSDTSRFAALTSVCTAADFKDQLLQDTLPASAIAAAGGPVAFVDDILAAGGAE